MTDSALREAVRQMARALGALREIRLPEIGAAGVGGEGQSVPGGPMTDFTAVMDRLGGTPVSMDGTELPGANAADGGRPLPPVNPVGPLDVPLVEAVADVPEPETPSELVNKVDLYA